MNDPLTNTTAATGDGRRASLLGCPRFWLAAQIAAVAALGCPLGLFKLTTLPDSTSYITASRLPFREMLGVGRTIGYPLFLRVVALVSPEFQAVPWIHFAMLVGTVFFLDFAVRRYGATPWEALAVSSGAFYAVINWMLPALLTDFAGQLAAIAAGACLFWLAAERKRVLPWLLLVLVVAAGYHIRPAWLFLMAWAPCTGLVLLGIHSKRTGQAFAWKGFLAGLCAASFLPYLAFCTLRWFVVGHFGLVSFGGYCVVGLAAELIEPEMIAADLSPEFRPLGEEILRGRREQQIPRVFRGNFFANVWQWERNHDRYVYFVVMPAADRLYGDDWVEKNRVLNRFSWEVLRARKLRFAVLFLTSLPWAAVKLLYRSWPLRALLSLLAILLGTRCWMLRRWGLSQFGHHARRGRDENRTVPFGAAPTPVSGYLLAAVFWVAVSLFLMKIAFVLLTIFAEARYVLAAGVFVPSLVALLILSELQRIRINAR